MGEGRGRQGGEGGSNNNFLQIAAHIACHENVVFL